MYILYVMEYNTQETVLKPKPICTVYSPHNLRNEILSRRKNCSQDGAIILYNEFLHKDFVVSISIYCNKQCL